MQLDGATHPDRVGDDVRRFALVALTLATIWLVLGQGLAVLRIAFAVLAILAVGWTMCVQISSYAVDYGPWPWPRPRQPMIRMLVTLESLWGVWFALVSGLLAAMLLFLRAAGYRLVRSKPQRGEVV